MIGIDSVIQTVNGNKNLVYADWTASGRLYSSFEKKLSHVLGPFVGNTHTEISSTGLLMTSSYVEARRIIKDHVHAQEDTDILLSEGSGMTGAINKFQRILGLKVLEQLKPYTNIPDEIIPVVLISHMEHHSNQTSWEETICIVEIVPPDENGLISIENFRVVLEKHKERKLKYASISACSNVTGVKSPYHEIAKLMHEYNGLCFVDFACSFGYESIDMHPDSDDESRALDAIFLSPHKLLGGPGSPGIVIFNKKLYTLKVPSSVGGGIVKWTNPWHGHAFIDSIEDREDCGTPGFLQLFRAALAVELKQQMGIEKILAREQEINNIVFTELDKIPNLIILAGHLRHRLSIFSIYIKDLHYHLFARLMNDLYGIQCRSGCNCAGTYGHILFNISQDQSNQITNTINSGDLSTKPGWVRFSFHPIMTNNEIYFICNSIHDIAINYKTYELDYIHDKESATFTHKSESPFVIDKRNAFYLMSNKGPLSGRGVFSRMSLFN